MADYYLELGAIEDEETQKYRAHKISHEEAYDMGIIDEFGAEYQSYASITCHYCGANNLEWNKYKGKWRLFEGGSLHDCPVNPLKE